MPSQRPIPEDNLERLAFADWGRWNPHLDQPPDITCLFGKRGMHQDTHITQPESEDMNDDVYDEIEEQQVEVGVHAIPT